MAFSWKKFFCIEPRYLYIFFIFLAALIGLSFFKSGQILLVSASGSRYALTIAFYIISAAVFYFIYCWILYGWNRHIVIKKD